MTTVFTAVAAKNTDETTVNNTAATSVKFSSHGSKIPFSVGIENYVVLALMSWLWLFWCSGRKY